jgi:phosphatidylglycerol:prolipoprotein diacylglycerol transferase
LLRRGLRLVTDYLASGYTILDCLLFSAGLLGSKILMWLVEPNIQVFSLDFLRSGGVYYGGLIGGFITVLILIRWYKLPFWKVADAFAPAVALGQAFGRQGCFAAGCCWGKGDRPLVGCAFLGKRT